MKLNSQEQIFWAVGVCDAAAQHLKLNQDVSKPFLISCLKEVYGVDNSKNYWNSYLKDQKKYFRYTQQGGEAFYKFLDNYDVDDLTMPSL